MAVHAVRLQSLNSGLNPPVYVCYRGLAAPSVMDMGLEPLLASIHAVGTVQGAGSVFHPTSVEWLHMMRELCRCRYSYS